MNYNDFLPILTACFKENRLEHLLDGDKSRKLFDFCELLIEKNKVMNLTAITDINGVIFKHFADCAKLCDHIPHGKTVADVGCGAGFPSLVLSILRPDLKVTPIDSTAKKVAFINSVAEKLGLDNIKGISARAEEFATENREGFDIVTSRAVARLNILCELCIPLVKVGGIFLPLKASKAKEELDEAAKGIKTLGASIENTDSYELTFNGERLERHIVSIKKVAPTNHIYPRKYAQILKKPL